MIKVLIADDEPLVRAGIKTVLPWNMYGFDVISEAADGKEAYEKILKLKPDILITDIKMPGNGRNNFTQTPETGKNIHPVSSPKLL